MDEHDWLAAQFEEHRPRLKGVAYRMLGSLTEADDAVQDTWLRVSRAGTSGVENVAGWLTTIVARVCLNLLDSRRARREDPFGVHGPEPGARRADGTGRTGGVAASGPASGADPEQEALLADSVGLALLVVLETLSPAERVAFVLHDVFAVSFEEIAPIVERSPAAARQLASRARRRVRRGQATGAAPPAGPAHQRAIVDAFIAAARGGDLAALLALLDPDVVLRPDRGAVPGGAPVEVRGAPAVAGQALGGARRAGLARPALVNGAWGIAALDADGRPLSAMGFTVARGKIVAIDVVSDPARLRELDLAVSDA